MIHQLTCACHPLNVVGTAGTSNHCAGAGSRCGTVKTARMGAALWVAPCISQPTKSLIAWSSSLGVPMGAAGSTR